MDDASLAYPSQTHKAILLRDTALAAFQRKVADMQEHRFVLASNRAQTENIAKQYVAGMGSKTVVTTHRR